MLRDDINAALKNAMKGHDKVATSTLRLILAAIKDREIAARGQDRDEADSSAGLSDQQILAVLQTMVKQRHDSIKLYEQGGRDDLVKQEAKEIEIIQSFLPKQMSADEVTEAVDRVIAETGAEGLKDMGRTMGLLRERYAGRMDFGKASAQLKDRLAG